MGKRKQKPSQLKKPKSGSSSSSSSSFDHSSLSENSLLATDSSLLLHEVQDSVSEIYREYLRDLKIRKHKRLELKNPTTETQLYNLVINPKYIISLKGKIRELIQANYICRIKNIIDEVLENFINSLKEFLKDAEDKSRLLQIVYLHETFHSLQNSITQISKIMKDLYSFEQFSFICLHKFYFGVLAGRKKLLNFAKSQDGCHFAIVSVIKMFEDLEKIVKTGECKPREIMYEVGSDIEESTEEPVHSLPLEDLVNYINGSPLGVKQKRPAKKVVENCELDTEIDEFQKRLEVTQPHSPKPSPLCSGDFLKILRNRYLEVRKKLLSN